MKILLLDAKEFAEKEGKVFLILDCSFNMRKYTVEKWSNGWCSVSRFKVDAEGTIIGRIANELIPKGIYNSVTVEVKETSRTYQTISYHLQEFQKERGTICAV